MEDSGDLPAGEFGAPPPPLLPDAKPGLWRRLGLATMVVSSVGLLHCRRELPWYHQFLLYCFLLSGWILVALSVGVHNSPLAKRPADLLAF